LDHAASGHCGADHQRSRPDEGREAVALEYVGHEKISLRDHADFDEAWLQDRIAEDPSILSLGNIEVLDRERRHEGRGRLDLLLADPGDSVRYEVELQLGASNPDHIIRCLEYWDLERRRYPAYDHVAVLVAEDVTIRFLNIISLFAGSVPIVALQLEALKVEEHVLLNFVKVLDQRSLRRDDETGTTGGREATRQDWVEYCGEEMLAIADKVLDFINEKAEPTRRLNFKEGYIGLTDGRRANNFIYFGPRKSFIHLKFTTVPDAQGWQERLEEAGLPAEADGEWLRVTVTPEEFPAHEAMIRDLTLEAVEEFQR